MKLGFKQAKQYNKKSHYYFFDVELEKLKRRNLYRRLRTVSTNYETGMQTVDGKVITVLLCSNDYLGLSQNAAILSEISSSLNHVSQCSSRLIAGNFQELMMLEEKLAQHRCTEASLVYPTGYMANLGVISAIADKETAIFSDQLNHASIIDGCRLSGATVKVFRHNDPIHLQELLQQSGQHKKKLVIVEGIFSMDGDIANLEDICKIAKHSGALIIVDDAHGDFIFDTTSSSFFSGIPAYLGVSCDIDIHTSSLSKALGCFGGYVATTNLVREFLINKSRQFIYTSALPQQLCISALASITLAYKGNLQNKLFDNIRFFGSELKRIGLTWRKPNSQIIPIIIGPEKLAVQFSNMLLNEGIFLQAIRYPTVEKGSARLRASLSALHTKHQLKYAIDSMESIGRKLKVI
jgi:glycine C-acetyltransferase